MRDTSTPPGGPPTFKQARRQQPRGSRQLVLGPARRSLDDEPVTEHPTRVEIRAELERARLEFRNLVQRSTPEDLARASNGTRWSNRELLFHMVFGYLITRNLRYLVKT